MQHAYERSEMYTTCRSENLKERKNLRDLGVDALYKKRMRGCGLDSSASTQGLVTGCCERSTLIFY